MGSKEILKESWKKYKSSFSYNSTLILYLIFGLVITSLFYFLIVFSDNTGFSSIGAGFLFILFAYLILDHFYYAFYGCMTFSFSLKVSLSPSKTFYQNYIRSYSYPFKGGLKVFTTLLWTAMFYLLLGSLFLYVATEIAYSLNNNIREFVDTFNELASSGASPSMLFDYYTNNGGAYEDVLKYANTISITLMIYFFVHRIGVNHVAQAMLFGPAGQSLTPTNYIYYIFRRTIRNNYLQFYSLYYGSNYPVLIIFYGSSIISTIVFSIFSSSFLFIVGASTLIALSLTFIALPLFMYNALGIYQSYRSLFNDQLAKETDRAINVVAKQNNISKEDVDKIKAEIDEKRKELIDKLDDSSSDYNEEINKANEELNKAINDITQKNKDKDQKDTAKEDKDKKTDDK